MIGSSRLTLAPASLTMKTWLSALRTERLPSESAVSAFSTAGSPVAPSSRTTASIAGNPLAVANLATIARSAASSALGRRRKRQVRTGTRRPMARMTVMNSESCSCRFPKVGTAKIRLPGGREDGARPEACRGQSDRRIAQLAAASVGALAAALAGGDVEVAARQRRAPIGDQVLGVRQVVRPLVADHEARRLPDGLELAVGLDLAD